MNVIDVLIIFWAIAAVIRGYYVGFLHQVLSLSGFIVGLLIGSWLAPWVSGWANSGISRLLLTLLVTFGLAFLLSSLGELIAVNMQKKIKPKLVHTFNAGLGIGFSVLSTLVIIWLVFTALSRLPLANIGFKIQESKALQTIGQIMPTPSFMERFARLLSPHGFPQIFVGDEPVVDPAGPPATPDVEAAAAKSKDSVVKLEGGACGGVSVGSGFVAADGFVVTNAHVIAGVREPVIVYNSERYRAVTIWFDPDLDFAVLRVPSMKAPALPLSKKQITRGKSAAVLGYPGGGRLTIDPAVILGNRQAVGRDIYGRGLATRQIYEVQADIEQGNSGGPLVLPNGSVAGVMFGKSLSNDNISYAISSVELTEILQAAIRENHSRGTGSCL